MADVPLQETKRQISTEMIERGAKALAAQYGLEAVFHNPDQFYAQTYREAAEAVLRAAEEGRMNFRAVVTWTSGVTEHQPCESERDALAWVDRWRRLNPGDVEDAWIERREMRWERV